MTARPPLSSQGHVVVVSPYPPQAGGTPVLMRNLLSCFDPSSFTVAAQAPRSKFGVEGGDAANVMHVMSSLPYHRPNRLWVEAQIPVAAYRIAKLARAKRATLLFAVYPDYHLFSAARLAAKLTRLPWVAYLHDTISEALAGQSIAWRASRLEARVFRDARKVFVMSRGMEDLYREKHHRETVALEHTYLEPIPAEPPPLPAEPGAFWGGAVYGINDRAVARVCQALGAESVPFLIATNASRETLNSIGVNGEHVKTGFYGVRKEYLAVVERQSLLVLALNDADECGVHEDELATIFPTKTPEYLASGKPILVHCPDRYFLARFFREHGAGIVVSDRSTEALRRGVVELRDPARARELGRRALDAARLFDKTRVSEKLSRELDHLPSGNA